MVCVGAGDGWELRVCARVVRGLRWRVARRCGRGERRLWLEDVGGREHVVAWQVGWLVRDGVGGDGVGRGEIGSRGNEGWVCMSR